MSARDIRGQGNHWNEINREISLLKDKREEAAREIEQAAHEIAGHMRTPGHRRPYITRSTEHTHLTEFDGEKFHFEIIDGWDGSFSSDFTLTAAQLADPDAEIERLKEEQRRVEIEDAEEAARRASERLTALQGGDE
jgi:hypothetical protein